MSDAKPPFLVDGDRSRADNSVIIHLVGAPMVWFNLRRSTPSSQQPMKQRLIDLSTFRSTVFTGRAHGERMRLEALHHWPTDACVLIRVPSSVFGVSSSFWIGLLGDRMAAAGTRERFYALHVLDMSALNQAVLDSAFERVKQSPSKRSWWARWNRPRCIGVS